MKTTGEDAPAYEKFLNSKFVDATLWVIVAISAVQLLCGRLRRASCG